MKVVRFSLMSASFLEETVETSPLVQQHAFVVMQAHREALKEARTLRTCRRSQLRFEDLKVGMKVRIMDDEEYVEAQCCAPAPGAVAAVSWADAMDAFIGCTCTVTALEEMDTDHVGLSAVCRLDDVPEVEIDEYSFPFHVLERV